ncbi:MAG TPA: hypothetical protein VFC46_06330 [Humisphaera sp.]|nr:hypothetical protein [Humisphaera sp.]
MMTAESTIIDERNDQATADRASESPVDLSVEQFSEIVSLLKAEANAGTDADERRQPRADLNARATIIPLRESCNFGSPTILVRNLSPSGIGFLYERPMSLDEQFALVLPRSGDTPAIVLCAVACWQPLAKDVYGIGARYVRILRDGGDPALPIEINPNSQSFAPVLQAVRAKAS